MSKAKTARAWTLTGAVALALTVGVFARRGRAVQGPPEEMRDAVMAPVSPMMAGGARVIQPSPGYFASPAFRRAEAEKALLSSRLTHVARAADARAAALRREAARSVTAQ